MFLTFEYLHEEYINKQRSTHSIAKELGVYANKVRRSLIQFGIPLRTHSQAGKVSSPMKGKKHEEETKLAISRGQKRTWANASVTKQKYAEKARNKWAKLTEYQKDRILYAAQKGIQKASREGSRLQRAIREAFVRANIKVHHRPTISITTKWGEKTTRPDLSLPEYSVVILVDGPGHFKPLWGAKTLLKTIEADLRRERILLLSDLKIIRVCQGGKRLTKGQIAQTIKAVFGALQDLRAQTAGGDFMDVFSLCEINVDKLEN